MASAWGTSWGTAWGNAWGTLATGASIGLTGIAATGEIGGLQVSADGNVIVQITGAGSLGALGTLIAAVGVEDALIDLLGGASTGAVGALAFTGSGWATLSGASATGFAGLIRLAELFTPSGRLLLIKKESRFLIIQADGTRFTTIQ